MRRVIAALVIAALAVGVVVFWPRSTTDDPPVTLADPPTTTTTDSTTPPSTTTTTAVSTTTKTTDPTASHVVETVEEAEAILRDLWFGWFEGIYNQDEERIREVVVLEETVETAGESFGVMAFDQPPRPDLIHLSDSEILRSDQDCLAVWSSLDVSEFRPDATGSAGVYVLRWSENGWAILSVWPNRGDLWEADCESVL